MRMRSAQEQTASVPHCPLQYVSYLKGVTDENDISARTDRLGAPLPVQYVSYLKGVTNENGGGWGKDANVGYWS
jgi:hypothetical protein